MGDSLCLQPWIHLTGNGNTIVQPAKDWADLVGYQDVTIYVELADCTLNTAGVTLAFQTSPSQDESLMIGPFGDTGAQYIFSSLVVTTRGVQPLKKVMHVDGNLARYLRWSVAFGPATIQLTFRIWLNLNPAGW